MLNISAKTNALKSIHAKSLMLENIIWQSNRIQCQLLLFQKYRFYVTVVKLVELV